MPPSSLPTARHDRLTSRCALTGVESASCIGRLDVSWATGDRNGACESEWSSKVRQCWWRDVLVEGIGPGDDRDEV